ncbi:MAG: hypothetical protein IJQ73_08520, partial [Kiritimatiellae bacterium]|nr:hypothetical protein [Kiritimatiellia bacterium]
MSYSRTSSERGGGAARVQLGHGAAKLQRHGARLVAVVADGKRGAHGLGSEVQARHRRDEARAGPVGDVRRADKQRLARLEGNSLRVALRARARRER